MSWYRYIDGIGVPRIKEYQVAFYDEYTGNCYDEAFYKPDEIDKAIPYITEPYCKLFAIFSKDEVYEITATRVER